MTTEIEPTDGILRRTVLKASALAASALAVSTPATADGSNEDDYEDEEEEDEPVDENDVDEPDGFDLEILAEEAPFADEVGVNFTLTYREGEMGTEETAMDDASNVVVTRLMWEPGGTSGWHTHPGPVVWSVEEGELLVENEDDCVTRTYTAGEVGVSRGQGNHHNVTNASETEPASTLAIFFGVPDGGELTEWIAPPC
ncbi:cupin domain-containing protein [Natrialbaceae archaeon A-gly3]